MRFRVDVMTAFKYQSPKRLFVSNSQKNFSFRNIYNRTYSMILSTLVLVLQYLKPSRRDWAKPAGNTQFSICIQLFYFIHQRKYYVQKLIE